MEERTISIELTRSECKFLKTMINAIVDDAAYGDLTERDMKILARCSTINKRIEDALMR